MTQRLEIRGLAVAYGRTVVVHGIDLHVQAGEMVALLGANGAGKTSILRAISHQQVTATGTLRFEGRDIIDMPAPAIASLGIAVPNFWLAMILVAVFSLGLNWFPATGAQPLRQDVRRNFPFAGILFEEYAGAVTLSTKATERLVPANEGIAFPLGTMDTFTTYGGPANLLETANTIGLPLYARQHLDEKGRWIDVMTEASILPVNKRPRIAIRIHTSN